MAFSQSLTWFVSRTYPLWDLVPYPLLICVCNYVSQWGWKLGVGCLWWEVRGDWWFTEERWWVIHLHKAQQSLWQHEWPVICHPAQRPPLRSSAGWDIYSPSASLPEASAYISLNCEAVVRQSKAACLSLDRRFAFLLSLRLSATHSNRNWVDMKGDISLTTHMLGHLN